MSREADLVARLRERSSRMNGALVGASDGGTYAVGYYDQFAAADDKRAADRIEALEVWKAEAMEVLRRHRGNTVPIMKALMATGGRADLILADDVHRADDAARRLVEKEDRR